jgi:hypothetical protein
MRRHLQEKAEPTFANYQTTKQRAKGPWSKLEVNTFTYEFQEQ